MTNTPPAPRRSCTISGPAGPLSVGDGFPPVVIAGPCVIESEELCLEVATKAKAACDAQSLPYVFKASFDKANRTSLGSARGPGVEGGLAILSKIRETLGVPVTTDLHEPGQAQAVAQVVDILQIPAFLCRQTDLLTAAGEAAAKHDRVVNIKKGQFLSPGEMKGPVNKVRAAGCENVIVTERGTFFGYNRLVNDFIGVADMADLEAPGGPAPVCFDCTHSAQLPGASASEGRAITGGRRDRVPQLAKAATAVGVDALFIECHPEPEKALSDAATMLPLADLPKLIEQCAQIAQIVRS